MCISRAKKKSLRPRQGMHRIKEIIVKEKHPSNPATSSQEPIHPTITTEAQAMEETLRVRIRQLQATLVKTLALNR